MVAISENQSAVAALKLYVLYDKFEKKEKETGNVEFKKNNDFAAIAAIAARVQ